MLFCILNNMNYMTPVIKENFIKLMAGSITADEFVSTMQDAAK